MPTFDRTFRVIAGIDVANTIILDSSRNLSNITSINASTFVTSTGLNVTNQANTARTTANLAYDQANLAYGQANTANTTASFAYNTANNKLDLTGGTITGNLSVTGNLILLGNTAFINTTSLSVNDSIILLASNNSGDLLDIGFVGHYDRGATNTHAGFIRKATENRFYLFDNYEIEPANNNIDVNSFNFRVGNLRLGITNSNAYLTTTGLNIGDQANTARDQANTATTVAQAAYGQANTATTTANNAANTVRVSANSGSTLSARQLNFVNTSSVTVTVTSNPDGSNANISFTSSATGSGTPGGSNTQIQFNNNGSFGGSSNLTFDLNGNVLAFGSNVLVANATSQNVGIGTTSPTYKLQVIGSFAANTKSFVIKHPTKENMFLRYGSLEGPENGVYIRGNLVGHNWIELPDYWVGLVHQDTITVNLTPIGEHQNLFVDRIENNRICISGDKFINCFYTVFAERKDVDKLIVEY